MAKKKKDEVVAKLPETGKELFELRKRISEEKEKLTKQGGMRTYDQALIVQRLEHELKVAVEALQPKIHVEGVPPIESGAIAAAN